jgi:hypothetical protein
MATNEATTSPRWRMTEEMGGMVIVGFTGALE